MNTLTLQGPSDKTFTVLSNDFLDNYMPRASGDFVKIYLYFSVIPPVPMPASVWPVLQIPSA